MGFPYRPNITTNKYYTCIIFKEGKKKIYFTFSFWTFCSRQDSIRNNSSFVIRCFILGTVVLNIQQGSRLVILQLGILSSRKPLTKVTNNLLLPLIKIKMESIDDNSAQQLTSSSVAVSTYACEIMKNIALNTVAD